MPRGIKPRQEDKQVLIDIIREEIEAHRKGKIKTFSSFGQLADISGIGTTTINRFINESLSVDEIDYRKLAIATERGKKAYVAGLANLTKEDLSKSGKKGGSIGGPRSYELHGPVSRLLSREDCVNNGRKSMQVRGGNLWTTIPYEQRRAIALERIKIHGDPFKSFTSEQRTEMGRVMGKRNWENGVGLAALTPEQLSEIGKRNWENGVGLVALTLEQRRKTAIENLDNHRKNSYFIEDRFHASSQQEGAVALMLEKYLPEYRTIEGETFQVRNRGINNGGLDFLAEGEFLEWHPVTLYHGRRGDIPSKEEAKSYKNILDNLSDEEKHQFQEEYKKVLALNYLAGRQQSVDNSGYAGSEVALATDVKGLYDFISKYSDSMPDFDDFRREFSQKVKYVKGFKVKPKAEAA
ncbi:MAG: hypothetical protein WC533_01880 [Candidatus Pacearchaeota archaeon]